LHPSDAFQIGWVRRCGDGLARLAMAETPGACGIAAILVALCRWLLLSLDRLVCNQLTMTQELIANMLGVRREGVTEAAGGTRLVRGSRVPLTILTGMCNYLRPRTNFAIAEPVQRVKYSAPQPELSRVISRCMYDGIRAYAKHVMHVTTGVF